MQDNPKITFFNDNPFYITTIDNNNFNLNENDWNNPHYVNILVSQPYIKSVQVTPTNFFDFVGNFLQVSPNNIVVTETIGEEPLCNYQIIYVDKINNNKNINQFATLLNTNGEVILGRAIIIKNNVPTLSNLITFGDMDSSELFKMIHERGVNKCVVWENSWREQEVFGSMELFANTFFENEPYEKYEIAFLKHNLNIWYLKSDDGEHNVCGKLLNNKVEKVLIFTLLTNDIRGNITKEEINKIIKLSTVLEHPYRPDNKWFEEEKDEYGREIIKNKYRVLDNIYNEYFGNKN